MPTTSRLFFALWPDDETRQALARLSRTLGVEPFKWVQPHNLHVTLAFLGQVGSDVGLSVKQSAAAIAVPAFELVFDTLSYWGCPKILCLTCRQAVPDEAMVLAAALMEVALNCGLQIDTRPYIPHITLARKARYLPDAQFEPIIWPAETFCLVESCSGPDGVCYKVIQQWPLSKLNTGNTAR
jgi:2'-5' RNA ligase